VSLNSEPDERAQSLGVRRSVALPEADIDAAGDLTPAAEPEPEPKQEPEQATAEAKEPASASKASPDTARDIAVAAPPADGDGDGDGDEMPPDRPKKPVLAAVAIGGAVVLAIPILLIGTGSHHGKKHRTVAAADTVLPGAGQQPPPGAFASASPTPTPSPSASAKKKVKPKPKETKKAAKKVVAKKAGFAGVSNVLLKNSASGLCADVPGYGRGSTDGPVAQYYCALGDADNQVWSLGVMRDMKGPGGTALFTIRNTTDDYCMDLPGYSGVSAGTKVTEYYCRPKGDNQLWYRSHTRGHLYRIRNYSSHGLCLGPTGRSHAQDKQLEIHKCGSGDEWSWPSGE
jgi:Ricin-type beta-trefoil lectin domain